MTLALSLGRRGLGQCWPNPSVGAVLADSDTGRVIGAAWTGRGGRPHAEALVLASAGDTARGATLYATLEPCSHWGKTPPCADAVVASGVKRLVYGIVDPDPRVAGQGLARMRRHGIEVVEGPLPREARWLSLGHALRVTAGRPFVQLKLAVDRDGLVPAGSRGALQFVTGEAARGLGHLMRAEADAILIGSGTLAADDPELTSRIPGLADRSPIRVVLASRGTVSPAARILRSAAAHPVWIVCAEDGLPANRAELERLGVVFIPVDQPPFDRDRSNGEKLIESHNLEQPAASRETRVALASGRDGRPDIRAVMQALAARGITRVLVEGGPALAASVLAADLVDEAVLFQAAAQSSGPTIAPFGPAGLSALTAHPGLRLHSDRLIGADRVCVYRRSEFC